MSTTGAALVHPSTSKLGPTDQAQGVYEYTPPMVLAYLRGEQLNPSDLLDVELFFGEKGMTLPRIVSNEIPLAPALAEPFYSNKGGGVSTSEEAPKRVLRKKGSSGQVGGAGAALFNIADVTLPLLTKEQQTYFFNYLAGQLGYDVE